MAVEVQMLEGRLDVLQPPHMAQFAEVAEEIVSTEGKLSLLSQRFTLLLFTTLG